MSTQATAADSTATTDDCPDTATRVNLPVEEPKTDPDSLTAAEAVAAAPSPFETTATTRLPNTTDGENEVVR